MMQFNAVSFGILVVLSAVATVVGFAALVPVTAAARGASGALDGG